MRVAGLALVAALVLALGACGGDDDEEAATTTSAPAATEPATAADCTDAEQPAPRAGGSEEQPTGALDAAKTYRLVVKTNCGDFAITLDQKASPKAAASMVALAQNDYFDDTSFHRIVPGFVIQGGDPSASGSGGPGYTTVDTPAQDTTYTKGTVAMAKAAQEPAGAAGSQFFVVTADEAPLPPDYAVVGRVTGGEEVVDRIGRLGDPTTEQPTQPVVISDMAVEVS